MSSYTNLKKNILSDQLDGDFATLYGKNHTKKQKKRYLRLLDLLKKDRPEGEPFYINGPGRTELGGNHTDHNHGCVVAAAVDLDIVAAVTPIGGSEVILQATDQEEMIRVDLTSLEPSAKELGSPEALIRGVAAGVKRRGIVPQGFHGRIDATCLPGSGLSSSAAFSLLVGGAFTFQDGGNRLSAVDLAQIAKDAENDFFGKPCGLMDQVASGVGQTVFIDFIDPDAPHIEKIDRALEGSGYRLLIIDTGGRHTGLTPEYAAIGSEMQAAAKVLGKTFGRNVSYQEFFAGLADIRKLAGDRAALRLLHFLEENERAQNMAGHLRSGSVSKFLSDVRESGRSSCNLLQNCSTVTSTREQGILLALAMSERICPDAVCRVHGGGFAGTVQSYVPEDFFTQYCSRIKEIFGAHSTTAVRIDRPGVCGLNQDGLLLPVER